MHLLQSCHAAHNHRVIRHDAVLRKLGQWLERENYDVQMEPHIPTGHTFVKPDLLLQKNGRYSVLDLCIPYESDKHALHRAEQFKADKYKAYEADVRRYITSRGLATPVGDIAFLGAAIGARGGIRTATAKLLGKMGIRGRGIGILTSMAIEGSIKILRTLRVQTTN